MDSSQFSHIGLLADLFCFLFVLLLKPSSDILILSHGRRGETWALEAMRESEAKLPHPLLVVDDRFDVLQALTRFFELDFERVFSASHPEAAERVLREEQPTFLMCDYWLGENYPPSTEFLPRWRQEFPCLRRVVLMTGTKSSAIPPCPAVDDIFSKPLRLASVVDYFRTHSRDL